MATADPVTAQVADNAQKAEGDISDQPDSSESFRPYVAHDEYKEITVRGCILASILAIILGSANVYLGLLVGLTISASIPASVLSMAALALFKDSNILENNIVQTAASAGEALAAGVIFTLPGLVIIENMKAIGDTTFGSAVGWTTFLGTNYVYITMIGLLGGILGIMFSIPIRKALIVDIEPPLKFPEGIATAGVLKAGESSGNAAFAVLSGGGVGGLTKIMETMGLWSGVLGVGWLYNDMYPCYVAIGVSPSLFAVGYIVGWATTIVLCMGSLFQHMMCVPVSAVIYGRYDRATWNETADGPFTGQNLAGLEFGSTKYIGVGLMITGGIWALISVRKALYASVVIGGKEFYNGLRGGPVAEVRRWERDIPTKWVLAVITPLIIGLYVTFGVFNSKWGWNVILLIFDCILAFLFSAVAAYMAGLVGSSNNPISGVTICSCLCISGLVVLMFGSSDPIGPPTVIIMSGAVACACAISGDNMQDLKAGHMLGATPWKQEIIMILGVTVTSFFVAPILELLDQAYTIGVGLTAPQAWIIATIPVGIANGTLPWQEITIGMGLGICIVIIDTLLVCFKVPFRLPVLAFAVAFYLPIQYITPMFVGGMVNLACAPKGEEDLGSEGVLFGAGMVAGDSIIGIIAAVPIVITSNSTVLQVIANPPMWTSIFPFIWLVGLLAFFAYYQPFHRLTIKQQAAKGGDDVELEGAQTIT